MASCSCSVKSWKKCWITKINVQLLNTESHTKTNDVNISSVCGINTKIIYDNNTISEIYFQLKIFWKLHNRYLFPMEIWLQIIIISAFAFSVCTIFICLCCKRSTRRKQSQSQSKYTSCSMDGKFIILVISWLIWLFTKYWLCYY